MSRALLVLRGVGWWAVLAIFLVWWLPTIALVAARLLVDRLRFRLALGLGQALAGVGLTDAARAVFAAEAARAGRRVRALRARRRW